MLEHNPMVRSISRWFNRTFADPEALSLFFTLLIGLLVFEFFGKILMPFIVSIILAYLLLSLVDLLEQWLFPHWLAVWVVYLLFLGVFAVAIFVLLPLLWKQAVSLLHEMPNTFTKGQSWFVDLIQRYPKIFSSDVSQQLLNFLKEQSIKIGHWVVTFSLSTIPNIIELVLYCILVPVLVFFFLKDGRKIAKWSTRYLPRRRSLISQVWIRAQRTIAIYVRARVLEIAIVGIISSVAFSILGLKYAVLLGVLVGLSVIIPYIGAVIVTIPIVIIALMDWGFSGHFISLMIVYSIIITFDGNLLVPILFSETMDLHPVVVILAVLVFGGIWGFWGIFFSIPLAAFVKIILEEWPKAKNSELVAEKDS